MSPTYCWLGEADLEPTLLAYGVRDITWLMCVLASFLIAPLPSLLHSSSALLITAAPAPPEASYYCWSPAKILICIS